MDDEARAWFKKIEDGDAEALELLTGLRKSRLSTCRRSMTCWASTSTAMPARRSSTTRWSLSWRNLGKRGLLKESNGALIVDLEEYKMPPCLIMKSDGATLYATRDLASAFWRKKEFDFYKCLYVVAYQQNLHFAQWFKVLELMGYEWAKDLVHVNFGMVSMEEGSMSTQRGPRSMAGGCYESRRRRRRLRSSRRKAPIWWARKMSRGRSASARCCSACFPTAASRTSCSPGKAL